MQRLAHYIQVILLLGGIVLPDWSFADNAHFVCVISTDQAEYTIGETPKFSVRILNKSTNEVMLVGGLDGSCVGWRFPKCKMEIFDETGAAITNVVERCGNMNPLKIEDFVAVAPSKEFNPFDRGFFSPTEFFEFPITKPGAYTIRFNYDTNAKSIEDYGVRKTEKIAMQNLFDRVPKLKLKSNDLKLTFK